MAPSSRVGKNEAESMKQYSPTDKTDPTITAQAPAGLPGELQGIVTEVLCFLMEAEKDLHSTDEPILDEPA